MSEEFENPRSEEDALQAARKLILAHRDDCLWFNREEVVPEDRDRIIALLRKIERHADRAEFVKARKLREWLSQNSSAAS
jgi:nuclear transport factor 2 (NTF2) superfamily protein